MVSSFRTRGSSNLDRELSRAYEGEVPPPFYSAASAEPRHAPARHHPGEIEVALPHALLPRELQHAPAVSLDELDDLVERRARREECGG